MRLRGSSRLSATRDAASMGRYPTLNQSCDFLLWTRALGRPRAASAPAHTARRIRRPDWSYTRMGGGSGRGLLQTDLWWECSLSNFLFLLLGVCCGVRQSRGACDGRRRVSPWTPNHASRRMFCNARCSNLMVGMKHGPLLPLICG